MERPTTTSDRGKHGPRAEPLAFDTDLPQIYHPRRMGQRRARGLWQKFFAGALLCVACVGCDRAHNSALRAATTSSSTAPARPTVASLVPAATDMIIAMGCGDQLVAISNF